MAVPRLSELLLPASATATATPDPSCVCNRYHNLWQCRILNPLNEARDQTCNLMVPSRIRFCCIMMGTPTLLFLIEFSLNPFFGMYYRSYLKVDENNSFKNIYI